MLLGKHIVFPNSLIKDINKFYQFGGSPIGNSRVKLTNTEDCIKNGYISKGEYPLEVAAKQLIKDKLQSYIQLVAMTQIQLPRICLSI